MRIWFKEWKDNHMIRDKVVSIESDDTRTHKIFQAIELEVREARKKFARNDDSKISKFSLR